LSLGLQVSYYILLLLPTSFFLSGNNGRLSREILFRCPLKPSVTLIAIFTLVLAATIWNISNYAGLLDVTSTIAFILDSPTLYRWRIDFPD